MLPIDQIICGDNCDVLGTFPRECIDLVVTSPPYDDLRTYGGHDWDFYGVAWQLKRVLKPGGVIVWVVADQTKDGSESGTSAAQADHFRRLGLRLHDTMIWNKYLPGVYGKRYVHAWEYMFVFAAGEPSAFNPVMRKNENLGRRVASSRGKNGTRLDGHRNVTAEESIDENVWRIPVGSFIAGRGDSWVDHPAMFPTVLAERHIRSWSNEGDIVLDPFNGSGTTTKMARELGRHWIGIDVNEEYCEIARRRMAQQLLPGMGPPVSVPCSEAGTVPA